MKLKEFKLNCFCQKIRTLLVYNASTGWYFVSNMLVSIFLGIYYCCLWNVECNTWTNANKNKEMHAWILEWLVWYNCRISIKVWFSCTGDEIMKKKYNNLYSCTSRNCNFHPYQDWNQFVLQQEVLQQSLSAEVFVSLLCTAYH